MRTTLILAALGAALLCPRAHAHPCFVGTYTATLACGPSTYEFTPGQFVGNGVWTGCLVKTVAGHRVATGEYELRLWSGNEGTISIREGVGIGTAVGTVDFATRTVNYLGTTYSR